MHANCWNCGDGVCAIDEINLNHRIAAVRFAFTAGVLTSSATDAARRINEKSVFCHLTSPFFIAQAGMVLLFSIRQAETLYSGILLRGSIVRCVS